MRQSFSMVLFVQFAVSFVSMHKMISEPIFRWELMNSCKSVMVLSTIFTLPLFFRWAICHCWLMAVVGPACSIGWLHTLYTVMIVICLFCLPRIVAHDRLPIPRGSSPYVATLGCNDGWRMIWVPPGLYGDVHDIVDSEWHVDEPLRCLLTISLYFVRAR